MTTLEVPEKTLTWEEVSIHIDVEDEDTIAEVKSDHVDDDKKEEVKDGYDIEDGRGKSSTNQPNPLESSHNNHPEPIQQQSSPAVVEDEVSEFCDETIIYIGRDVPNKIIVEKKEDRDNGCTQTVISELTRPDAKRRRRNRRRRRRRRKRIRIICSLIILLTLVFGIILILIFTGVLNNPFYQQLDRGGDDGDVDTSVAAVPRMPSIPVRACVQEVNSEYTIFGSVAVSLNTYPPNVAIEGKNSVAVSNTGDIKFYKLNDDVWQEIDSFINVNTGKFTPAVSISGTTVVVGYLYDDTEVEQGGVHVYEQRTDGRWERVDIFVPASAVDSTAKYGWSVDVSSTPSNTMIVVGSPEENSVYVYQKIEGGSYDSIGKLKSQTCNNNFGYAVAVYGYVIAATTDCKYIVQLYEYTDSNIFRVVQNIRYVNFEHGAVSRLQMNEKELVYSTVFGAVSIFRRAGSSRSLPFSLDEQVDVSVDNITEYPLSMDTSGEILVVGKGNSYMVLPKLSIEGSFLIENKAIEDDIISSVAVSGNVVLASSMSDIIQYNVERCTGALPTQSPTTHSGPILSDSDISSLSSQTVTRPDLPDDSSNEETAVNSKIPAALPAELGSSSICHPLEVSIVFDNSSLGIGYVITNVDTVESLSYFPADDSFANQEYNERLCLEEGRYTFVLYDTIGNGLCCDNGNGSYRVTSNGITLAQGAQFTYSDEMSFELPV